MRRPTNFLEHIQKSLTKFRLAIAVVGSLVISSAFGTFVLIYESKNDLQAIETISPYLVNLVDASDRPETLRVINSIKSKRNADIIISIDDTVFASTRNLDELDRTFASNEPFAISSGQMVRSIRIGSTGSQSNLSAVIFTPLLPIFLIALGIGLVSFLASLGYSLIANRKMKRVIEEAVAPVKNLEQAILGLTSSLATPPTDPIFIKELESIREAIVSTHEKLINTQEELSKERAKQMASDAYKQLIHDLHNPVAALRQMLKVLDDGRIDEASKIEASARIPALADQILKQVTSARSNLELDPRNMKMSDLRESVKSALEQVRFSNDEFSKKEISFISGDEPLMVAHDSALLVRAFSNLIKNGVEASKAQVKVEIRPTESGAKVLISDDGLGMNTNDVSLFLQGRGQSTKSNREGLGLSSAYHIIKTHNGKMVYRSSSLGGACFEIQLEGLC